ncbi:MAG: HAMP domain-containing histidine kinase [Flavobacteriia bacterium]|nr:HAMP domain-containing histidine kinase [Flavobacteriia bacterium]
MKTKNIKVVILLGIVSLASILFTQMVWIRKTIAIQETNIAIQEKDDSLKLKQFSEQTHIALRNVLEIITNQHEDSVDLYGAVKQLSTNYFVVDISEELHPYYLENLLKRELYNENIREDFQYGIYDCFSDSIVFGNLIKFTKDSLYAPATDTMIGITSEKLRWKTDGHYFTVYFPNIVGKEINPTNVDIYSPWFFVIIIVIIVLFFFSYTLLVILKQKRLSEVKNDFINNMTHELKTPISTIGLSSEMLLKNDFKDDPERLKRYAEIIYKENKRLENQVERVLNVAKLDKEKLVLKKTKIYMHEVIDEAKEIFEFNQIEEGTIQLQLNAESDLIIADSVHITNVIYNLIDNAIKYSDKNIDIFIKTYNDKKSFNIEIEDHGLGIKKDDLKMIFDKFYRVPTGNLHNVKGFGLGLYYVKLIIDEHGGSINVKSSYGKGTTFIISLPIK